MRLGIILRLLGAMAFVAVVALEGSAIKDHAFEGKSEHYTVVLSANADQNAAAKKASKQGASVDHIVTTDTIKAYEASMTSSEALKVENDPSVDYIEMDSQTVVHHTWMDTTLITLGLRSPHLI